MSSKKQASLQEKLAQMSQYADFSDDDEEVVTVLDETVSPQTHAPTTGGAAFSEKIQGKYNVVLIEEREVGVICCGLIGGGSTVCLKLDCQVNHRRAKTIHPSGMILIRTKNASSAFAEPSLEVNLLPPETLTNWLLPETKHSVDDWRRLITAAEYFDSIESIKMHHLL